MLFVETAEKDGTDVALVQSTAADQFDGRVAKIVDRPIVVHAIDLCRVQKTLHVLAQPEDRRAAFGGVTTDAFKNARAVMHHVRHDVYARVIPLNELAIMPTHVTNAWSGYVLRLAASLKHIWLLFLLETEFIY